MKDLVTYIAKTVADKFANITDNNEMFSEARKQELTPQEHEEAKKRRIEDIEAQIKALQDELAQIKASDKGEKLEDIEKKAKRKAAAKNAVATKKKNKEFWANYTSGCGGDSGSANCSSSGFSSRGRSYSGCGSGWASGGCY